MRYRHRGRLDRDEIEDPWPLGDAIREWVDGLSDEQVVLAKESRDQIMDAFDVPPKLRRQWEQILKGRSPE